MKKMFNEGNQIHNFMSSSGSGTVINYRYGSGSGSGSTTLEEFAWTIPILPNNPAWQKYRYTSVPIEAAEMQKCYKIFTVQCCYPGSGGSKRQRILLRSKELKYL
jgi:hypothetical protein